RAGEVMRVDLERHQPEGVEPRRLGDRHVVGGPDRRASAPSVPYWLTCSAAPTPPIIPPPCRASLPVWATKSAGCGTRAAPCPPSPRSWECPRPASGGRCGRGRPEGERPSRETRRAAGDSPAAQQPGQVCPRSHVHRRLPLAEHPRRRPAQLHATPLAA